MGVDVKADYVQDHRRKGGQANRESHFHHLRLKDGRGPSRDRVVNIKEDSEVWRIEGTE